jgi:hypothetical protein
VNATPVTRIWIVRRGNGKLEVTPSPAHLPSASAGFSILNMTELAAHVVFDARYVAPPESDIASGATGNYTVVGRGPVFFEYQVTFPGGQYGGESDKRPGAIPYAEGGSQPGGIIDP